MKKGIVPQIIEYHKQHFNAFKREIDRKYTIYDIFRYVDTKTGYKIEKYIGSNQVILYYENKEIYNSDHEGKLKNVSEFTKFLNKELIKLCLLVLPNGLNDTKGT